MTLFHEEPTPGSRVSRKIMKMLYLLVWFSLCGVVRGSGHRDMAWSGGPARLECDHAAEMFMLKGQHVKENVIAVKAIAYKDDVYVLTPRYVC